MAELIERDGKSVVVTKNEIGLDDLEKEIKIAQANIDSIDYNMKGLQQRRDKLVDKLTQLNTIKDSLPVQSATATTTTTTMPEPLA